MQEKLEIPRKLRGEMLSSIIRAVFMMQHGSGLLFRGERWSRRFSPIGISIEISKGLDCT